MIDFHKEFKEFGEFDNLKSHEKSNNEEKKLSLSEYAQIAKLSSTELNLAESDIFYQIILDLTTAILNKAADEKDKEINGEAILGFSKELSRCLLNSINPDDLVRLAFQHDEFAENYLYIHSVNVCLIAARIALGLGFSDMELSELVVIALFHDIGMMKMVNLWNKKNDLNKTEIERLQTHPVVGSEIFKILPGMTEEIARGIAQHQEKSDGTGYPERMLNDNICYPARLVSIVDRYVALTHSRLWRRRFLPDKAIQHILDYEYNSYDEGLMMALLRHISTYPVGTYVRLSTGEIGKVMKTNDDKPVRPVVKIIFDKKEKRLKQEQEIDLSQQLLIHVQECVEPEDIRDV